MLKRVYLLLTVTGNAVLISSLIAVAVRVQLFQFEHSLDIRISWDIFIPFVASTVVLCFLSVLSIVMLAVSVEISAFMESKSKIAKIFLAVMKLTLTALIFVVVAVPFMTPRLQTSVKVEILQVCGRPFNLTLEGVQINPKELTFIQGRAKSIYRCNNLSGVNNPLGCYHGSMLVII